MTTLTLIHPLNLDSEKDFTFANATVTSNVVAGNIKTNHLLYANGQPWVLGQPAGGNTTEIQFNNNGNFTGSSNLTFNSGTGTLTVTFLSGDGTSVTNVNATTLNGHSDTYFATSAQGTKADSAVQPGNLSTVATTGAYSDLTGKPTLFDGTYANLTGKPTLFDGEYASLANKPALFDGTYANLTGKPTLGTAAATNANAYATAAQGLLADSAIQTGANISVFTNDSGYLVAANLSGYATESYVGTQISNLVDAAPATLNTLNELAAALGDDANFATTIANSIGNKLSTSDFTSTADTWLGTKTTSNVSEGTNLYYTTTRANTAIDNRVTKTFVDNLSVVANVSNIAYSVSVGNVSGIGNIATLNLDGNASTILYGNGVFAAAPLTYSDSNVTTFLGSLGSNSISTTGNVSAGNIKTDHLLYANGDPYIFDSVPVVVSANPPLTPVEGDLWLDSDTGEMSIYFGGAWVAPTTSVSTALTVTDNAQPNITSVGTLTGLTVNGNITANYFIGNGSQLTGLPAGYTDTDANAAIDARVTKTFVDNLGINANTLNGHSDTYFATSTQGSLADSAVQPGDLATVATTGSYTDLLNKPTLFDGTYANLTGKPTLSTVATSGSYSDLLNTPTLFDGEYSSLANKPTLFDGTYANLTGKPTLGTAAATNANAYATAAQGLLADSAIQSGANISVFTNDSGYLVAANLSGYATETYVGTQISNLVDAAPATLNTLNELAAALGDDANFATTIANSIGNKLSTSDFTSTADTWLGTKSTTNVAEGTNLYYTATRANSAIDARVTKTFVDNLSVVANIANVAYSVAVANVSGIGNIATVNLDGNASTILYGNGTFAAAPVTYNDSNVATYLPNYTGNLTPGNIIISSDNLKLSGGTANYVLSTDGTGNLSWVQQTAGGTSESTVTSVDTFTGDGTTTVFTLSVAPANINQTFVNYNGALQLRSSYTLSGQDITFSEAPADGSEFEITTQMGVTSGSGSLTVRNYTANGSQTDFAVSSGVNATNILVTENGLLQTPTVDYTVTGSTLTFTTAPGNGVKVQIRELGVAVATITPAGSNTQVLFNDAGSFGNSSNFTFNKTTNTLSTVSVVASGNITANYVIGNGSQLTGLPAGYTDSNVASYLPTYTGNLSPGNISLSVSNLKVSGGTSGQALVTDGAGNLSFSTVSSSGPTSASVVGYNLVFGG